MKNVNMMLLLLSRTVKVTMIRLTTRSACGKTDLKTVITSRSLTLLLIILNSGSFPKFIQFEQNLTRTLLYV